MCFVIGQSYVDLGMLFDLTFASAAFVMLIGFMFGGLATGLTLMLAGAPIARLAGNWLESPWGTAIALGTAIAAAFGIYVLAVGQPFVSVEDIIILPSALCFAVPAAVIYRRQVLLERALEPA
jgi:hypothetical protein